jgi:hypothetical protein
MLRAKKSDPAKTYLKNTNIEDEEEHEDGYEVVNSSCKCTMNSLVHDFMRRLIIEAFPGSMI